MGPFYDRTPDLFPSDLDARGRRPDGRPYRETARRHRRQRPEWLQDLIDWTRP
ncbi:hypothetical protein [Pseudooceanicola spongiae]|uniref:hypothetical protein n=1 Tax=Pseudooceanicola spongiae TaxID=2613965 RepID=UPI001869313C|nr:hypothetical protein [Pseudooceanicola spongiae]